MKNRSIVMQIIFGIILLVSCTNSNSSLADSQSQSSFEQSDITSSESNQSSSENDVDHRDLDHYDLMRYMEPLWSGNVVTNEPVMILKNETGSVDPLKLLYPIDHIISVRNYGLNRVFVAGEDYDVVDKKLVIYDSGSIYRDIALNYNEYYFPEYDPTSGSMARATNGGGLLSTEASYGIGGLCDFQIAVTYTHEAASVLDVPETKKDKLSHTLSKLNNSMPLNLTVLGDSISAGWSASGYQYANIDPHSPPYANMFKDFLQMKFPDSSINLTNLSVGGKTAEWGAESTQIANVLASNPDLVIVAFGMNDGISGGYTVESYQYQINQIIDEIHNSSPQTEFIIVSTMIPNAEVYGILRNQYNYLAALQVIETERNYVSLADMSTESLKMLFQKRFMDISANNKNHPNDFVHRLYAQVLAKTLLETI